MKKEITIKLVLKGKQLKAWEDGHLSLIDEISSALDISQEDVDVFEHKEIK